MFEVYMEGHGVSPQQRARMMMALVASLAITSMAGTASWGAGKLSIGTVGPPQGLEVLELTLMTDMPPQQAEPPERAKDPEPESASSVAAARMTTRPRRGERKPSGDDGPPIEGAKDRGEVGVPEGDERGEIGIPGHRKQIGCLGVGCVPDGPITTPPQTGVPKKRGTQDTTERAPLSVLRARSIFTPDPRPAALAKTKTGLGSRAPGRVKVDFCVGTDGRVSSAKVAKRFGGDPEVDRICTAAVKTWRFKPARMGGKARTTCSDVTFQIQFE